MQMMIIYTKRHVASETTLCEICIDVCYNDAINRIREGNGERVHIPVGDIVNGTMDF